jgi:hypothetical protein
MRREAFGVHGSPFTVHRSFELEAFGIRISAEPRTVSGERRTLNRERRTVNNLGEERFVHFFCFGGNGSPAELFDCSLAPSYSELFAQ